MEDDILRMESEIATLRDTIDNQQDTIRQMKELINMLGNYVLKSQTLDGIGALHKSHNGCFFTALRSRWAELDEVI